MIDVHTAACNYAMKGTKKAEQIFRDAMAAAIAAGIEPTEYAIIWFSKLPNR